MQRNTNLTETPASSLSASSSLITIPGPTPEDLSLPVSSVSFATMQQLITLRRDQFSLFSRMPADIINLISQIKYDPKPESDIGLLLQYAAYADKEKINIIKSMLDQNPGLLLWASDTTDPAENLIKRVTPYQFALLAGDDYLADIIAPYFEKLGDSGKAARAAQYAECKAHIDTMLSQPAYDFSQLIQHFKNASMESVQAALKCQFDERKYPLHAALAQFKQDFAPRTITEGMHFNYNNLLQAFRLYTSSSFTFDKNENFNLIKCDLFWRQIVGYIQRRLPSCDLQAFAQGTYNITELKEPMIRRFNLSVTDSASAANNENNPFSELGYKYALGGGSDSLVIFTWSTISAFENLCRRKFSNLKLLSNSDNCNQIEKRPGI